MLRFLRKVRTWTTFEGHPGSRLSTTYYGECRKCKKLGDKLTTHMLSVSHDLTVVDIYRAASIRTTSKTDLALFRREHVSC